MSEPIGPAIFAGALRALGRALDARRGEARFEDLLALSAGSRGSLTFGVGIYDEALARVVDRYEIRMVGSRFEVVDHGHCERPVDWQISVDEVRRIGTASGAACEDPSGIDLGWLEARLGLCGARERRGGAPR